MRPAQLTPENINKLRELLHAFGRFNEAGAINAGKHDSSEIPDHIAPGFNEAGAINAGKRYGDCHIRRGLYACFNEAGAINAGKLTH